MEEANLAIRFPIYDCVDVDRFRMPQTVEDGRLKVGIVSNNTAKKGIGSFVDLAIAAGLRRPDIDFIVIGPLNQLTERLKQAAAEALHQVNLRFTDYVADPAVAMRQINVLMSLSEVPESFGRTIIEAMAAGRPVVAYRAGAIPELVRHGVDGFLIPQMQSAAALDHLAELADSPSLLLQLGQNARERALKLFSSTTFAVHLNAAYVEILFRWEKQRSSRAVAIS